MIKNLINYYYGLIAKEIRKIDQYYIFNTNECEYEFFPYYGDINELYKTYIEVMNYHRYLHEIVFNKNNHIITFFNQIPYILIKKNNNSSKIIDLNYIINYDCKVYSSYKLNWKELWKSKVDYYEYQVKELGIKHPKVLNSFSYYIGMSEAAINLLNYTNINKIDTYISHKRITSNDSESSFLNPTKVIFDSMVRDIAEYIKSCFMNEKINIQESLNMIDKLNLKRDEAILLLSRLIYPSYYFDIYDSIIQEKASENKLDECIKKSNSYETFLKNVYNLLHLKYNIPEIEWLSISQR